MRLFLRALLNLIRHLRFTVAAAVPLFLAYLVMEWSAYHEGLVPDAVLEVFPLSIVLFTALLFAFVSMIVAVGAYRTFLSPRPPPIRDAFFGKARVYRSYFPRTLVVTILAAVPAMGVFLTMEAFFLQRLITLSGTTPIQGAWIFFLQQQHLTLVFSTLAISIGVSLPAIANGRHVGFWRSIRVGIREVPAVLVAVALLTLPVCFIYATLGLDAQPLAFEVSVSGPVAIVETLYVLMEMSILAEVYRRVRPSLGEEDPDGPVDPDVFA
ncbi:MAG: hypothetical protein AAGA87_03665 [Pseudomonadota bacterium]